MRATTRGGDAGTGDITRVVATLGEGAGAAIGDAFDSIVGAMRTAAPEAEVETADGVDAVADEACTARPDALGEAGAACVGRTTGLAVR